MGLATNSSTKGGNLRSFNIEKRTVAIAFVVAGAAASGVVAWKAGLSGLDLGLLATAAGLSLAGGFLLWNSAASLSVPEADDVGDIPLAQRQHEFEQWRDAALSDLQSQQELLTSRERDLAQRFVRHQEVLEYPVEPEPWSDQRDTAKLSEQDRQVREILEAEAERVYEKIRKNGYSKKGSVDAELIHQEIVALVTRVAQVYSPESKNPIMETSFEQLARSASRICMHSLVLLERMPLDVKTYNLSQMHTYIRRAAQTYGAYQQAAPWLKVLSRGAYAGRIAAGANPVTLGAWWLASEVGRRGATKLVQNVVDQQAVTLLHDFITVIGVEAANIYGPGFRQRDPAWIYAAELTEMLQRFPVSHQSLSESLREIAALPLQNEYDRVYLYRCLADHRSAGFRLKDPATIPRNQRDEIAKRLESFFTKFVHGAKADDRKAWQDDVESRLDLRLQLDPSDAASVKPEHVESAILSVYDFLVTVAAVDAAGASEYLAGSTLFQQLTEDRQVALRGAFASRNDRFEPPELDPAASITDDFLHVLNKGLVATHSLSPPVETLAIETAGYFRRSREDAERQLQDSCKEHLESLAQRRVKLTHLSGKQLCAVARCVRSGQTIVAAYTGISIRTGKQVVATDESVLVVLRSDDTSETHAILIAMGEQDNVVWTAKAPLSVARRKGLLLDDCEVTGGQWLDESKKTADAIIVAGYLTGGGYEKTFACLIACAQGAG